MTKIKLERNFNCALCGKPVTAENVLSGWIIKCGCGIIHTTHDLLTSPWYKPTE